MIMLTLSPAAREELDAYFAGREKTGLRIYAAPGGCSGRRPALMLGEPAAGDVIFESQGYTFSINPDLLARLGTLSIDLSHTGFSINSGAPLEGAGCSSCAGCGPGGDSIR